MNSSALSCGESGPGVQSLGTGNLGLSFDAAPTCRSLYTTRPQTAAGAAPSGVSNEKYCAAWGAFVFRPARSHGV